MWLLRSVYIFFYVATVMAQELPGDYSLWDDSESFKNDDLIDLSVATDLPFTTAGFASPEVESMSPLSCLSWDIMDVQIPSSVRARDEGISSCPAEAPPASSLPSFQDLQQGVWNILDQAGDDDTRKLSPGTESRPARGDLILEDPEDPRSCLPEFPFRLCCRDPGTVGEYQITENTVYTTFRRCELSMSSFIVFPLKIFFASF